MREDQMREIECKLDAAMSGEMADAEAANFATWALLAALHEVRVLREENARLRAHPEKSH